MTQEDKKLLLIDLYARLPYGVKVQYNNEIYNIDYISTLYEEVKLDIPDNYTVGISEIKPYLRPMSSMTEEEREEWADLFNLELDKLNEIDDENEAEELAPYYFGKSHQVSIDWLNEHYFDYRGLIEKGLAIEAPEGMYNLKKQRLQQKKSYEPT